VPSPVPSSAPSGLAGALDDLGCVALLVLAESARDPDVAHFAGALHVGRCLLVLPRRGAPRLGYFTPMERDEAAASGLRLLTPHDLGLPRAQREGWSEARTLAAAASAALTASGAEPGRVALAGHGPAGTYHQAARQLAGAGWSPVDGNDLARRLRKRKAARQLAGIRRAAAGTVTAFRRVAELLAAAEARPRGATTANTGATGPDLRLAGEALTVGRLRAEIAAVLAAHGLEQPAGNIVAPGRDAAVPHSAGRDERVLRAGESLVVDLYPAAPPFADCTRTFCVGRAPEALVAAHAAVREALDGAHRSARPGVRGADLQRAACDSLEARGYPTLLSDPETDRGYVHNLGHGVGYELHEYPSFRKQAGAEGVLEAGDVLTLEPGLYDPAAGWGVRLEDLVWLRGERAGETAAEILTPLPYELDPRAWAG